MHIRSMADITAGYLSSEGDWVRFLNCWRAGVEKRLAERTALPANSNRPDVPGSRQVEHNSSELATAESRIGRQLPASYRHFVLVTGGKWLVESAGGLQNSGPSGRFLQINQIGSFKAIDAINWKAWETARAGVPTVDVAAEEYYRYGYRAKPLEPQFRYRSSHLDHLIKVGELEQGSIVALNPAEVTSDKEWEAWLLSPQVGAMRYRSFAELMQHIAYQDIGDTGGAFLPSSTLQSSCAGLLRTAATL